MAIRRLLAVIVISAWIGVFPVLAGDTFVNGSVSGVWHSGQVILVKGAIWIEENALLRIEQGVQVDFQSTESFVVSGNLIAEGAEGDPIIFLVPDGWAGMEFTPNVQDIQHLNAVRVGTVGGLPRRVITSAGARLEIQDCIFKAAESCLDVDSGRVRARGNFFTTTRLLSKTVSLRNLRSGGLNSFACEDSAASTL